MPAGTGSAEDDHSERILADRGSPFLEGSQGRIGAGGQDDAFIFRVRELRAEPVLGPVAALLHGPAAGAWLRAPVAADGFPPDGLRLADGLRPPVLPRRARVTPASG